MKKVRILLRVSSHQQLESDGDLSVQREIVLDYIQKHEDWKLDDKEYFEGAESGYQNSVKERDILSDIERDAVKQEFDILVVYKDDRLGRRMWEIGAYVMQLKSCGVDIYTTKDGCISPEHNDIMGQMMLALRYGNAQKSSVDTGQRVKDTAQKLVKQGRFLGGRAPYGYELVLSGEISKHGRALHKLQIVPEQIEAVKKIYALSFEKEYGSLKIAKALNLDPYYQTLAPNDVWKSGTISSILTNPIYCGITAYKRRERNQGGYHRLDCGEWVYATEINPEIAVIDREVWNAVQRVRSGRTARCQKLPGEKKAQTLFRNDGELPLIDVAYCGYCGKKLTNGNRYNYWTIKSTGEKKTSKIRMYKCITAWQGIPHNKVGQFPADEVENIVFDAIGKYVEQIQREENLSQMISEKKRQERAVLDQKKKSVCAEISRIQKDIEVMKSHIPAAMSGNYPLHVECIAQLIQNFEEKQKQKEAKLQEIEAYIENARLKESEISSDCEVLPTWKEVFLNADKQTKRVLINRLIEKVTITREKITITCRIQLNGTETVNPAMNTEKEQSQISGDSATTPYTHGSM